MRRDVFQAIADPTRRAIITLIAVHALTPNAIAAHFDTSRQAVSKHLRILTECELVEFTENGREIYYHLNINKMKEIDVEKLNLLVRKLAYIKIRFEFLFSTVVIQC